MHYGHVIDPQRKFIYQVFEGEFSIDQLIACTRRLWNDPLYSKLYSGMTDIARMTPSGGLGNLQELITFLKTHPETSQARWAVIAATPMATAGAMVYQRAMAAQHSLAVFSTWESACSFLQLELPARPAITVVSDFSQAPSSPVV